MDLCVEIMASGGMLEKAVKWETIDVIVHCDVLEACCPPQKLNWDIKKANRLSTDEMGLLQGRYKINWANKIK